MGIGQFVEVDQFVEADHQTAKTCKSDESRQELELIVDGGIINDGSYTQGCSGISLSGELSTQPTDGVGLELLVAFFETSAIGGNHLRKIIPVDHLGQLGQVSTNNSLAVRTRRLGFGFGLRDELLNNALHSPSVGLRTSRHVFSQLGVKRTCLSTRGM